MRKSKSNPTEEKLVDECCKLKIEGFTLSEIAEKINYSTRTVSDFLKKGNCGGLRKSSRKDHFNENYFEVIDSEDKAYFLGLLYSDGNIYMKRMRVQLTLINSDKYILETFQKCINSTGKIYSDRGKYSKIILDSKKMVNDLIKLGCIPQKCFKVRFPDEGQIPDYLMRHFIRGYFDGDGHIGKRSKNAYRASISSNYQILSSISLFLNNLGIETSTLHKRYPEKEQSSYSIHIKSRSIKKLLAYMYKDSNYHLTRKQKFYNDQFENISL